jgi:hypothetical protein
MRSRRKRGKCLKVKDYESVCIDRKIDRGISAVSMCVNLVIVIVEEYGDGFILQKGKPLIWYHHLDSGLQTRFQKVRRYHIFFFYIIHPIPFLLYSIVKKKMENPFRVESCIAAYMGKVKKRKNI